MGEGIVRTVDNFGVRGETPSHPELLDHLATQWVRGDWQLKPLVRSIVTSQAYARSSAHSDEAIAVDPENRAWWRMPRRRIPAESIRDTMLLVSGQLDLRPSTEPVKSMGKLVSGNKSNDVAKASDVTAGRRSIYQAVVRSEVPPLLATLDAADPDLIVGQRPITNVPTQALLLINSPEVRRWADATVRLAPADFDARLRWLIRTTLQRNVAGEDIALARSFGLDQPNSLAAWSDYVVALFASTEFRTLD